MERDDPARVAGPGELPGDVATAEPFEYDTDDWFEPTDVAPTKLGSVSYLGVAGLMAAAEWTALNAVHLRERWRAICDAALEARANLLDPSGYDGWCAVQYELQQAWPGEA